MPTTTSRGPVLEALSILFADISGFSGLKEAPQHRAFFEFVLPLIRKALYDGEHQPEKVNTWGDGLFAYFRSPTYAVHRALELRDLFRKARWADHGLPRLRIRIALHAGEAFIGRNPVTLQNDIIGTEVNRAARLEPVVKPDHVYATRQFRDVCRDTNVEFQSLGNLVLPKGWGSEEVYVVGRKAYDTIDPKLLLTEGGSKHSFTLAFPPSSQFGGRMLVTQDAKKILGDYCVRAGFWRPDEVVFLESGTIPVYMLDCLYQLLDPASMPRLLVTNNIVCSGIAMMAHASVDASFLVHPLEKPMDVILTGGRVFDDYGATIPEDLVFQREDAVSQSGELIELLNSAGVNHVVMMVTRLSREHGPCSRSLPTRRFKKLLLRYVAGHKDVRLSILAEVDKLAVRGGDPADTVDLPDEPATSYWDEVLKRGPTVIVAMSQELKNNEADLGLAKREMMALKHAGATCILLGTDGSPISLE